MIIMIMDKNAIKGRLKNVVLSYFSGDKWSEPLEIGSIYFE